MYGISEFAKLEGLELRVKVEKDEQFHELSFSARACTSITRPGSNALFSILPLQFT